MSVTLALFEGYQPYFSFSSGFEPESDIASTTFDDLGFVGYQYTVTYNDGSSVVFTLDDKNTPASTATFDNVQNYHFSTDAAGHRILDQGGAIRFIVYDSSDTKVLTSSDGVLGNVSVLSSDFVPNWLAGDNFISPDQSATITSDQVIHGYGGLDLITGGEGNDTIFLDKAGAHFSLQGGTNGDSVAGSDTFVFPAHVVDSHGGLIAGNDPLVSPQAGDVNTIEALGNNDFSPAVINWINRIAYDGAHLLKFGAGNFDDTQVTSHIASDATVVGDDGANALKIWVNPADISSGHSNFNEGVGLDLSHFTFENWTPGEDSVTIIGNMSDFSQPQLVAPDVSTKMIGSANWEDMIGGAAADTLLGAGGLDTLIGHGGNDVLAGGAGNDTLSGGTGQDKLTGGTGDDLLNGNAGADNLVGNGGNDNMLGGNGNDSLFGGVGLDSLSGGRGNDHLYGGNGADILNGNIGNDVLDGGGGPDTFVFNNGFGHDTIADFNTADGEKIDLSHVTAIGGFYGLVHYHLHVGADGFAEIDAGSDNSISLHGITVDEVGHGLAVSAADFIF